MCCGEEKTEIDRAARRGGKRSRLIHLFLHGLSSLFRQLNSFSLANLHARFLRHSGRQISFSLLSDELRNSSSSSKTKQKKSLLSRPARCPRGNGVKPNKMQNEKEIENVLRPDGGREKKSMSNNCPRS